MKRDAALRSPSREGLNIKKKFGIVFVIRQRGEGEKNKKFKNEFQLDNFFRTKWIQPYTDANSFVKDEHLCFSLVPRPFQNPSPKPICGNNHEWQHKVGQITTLQYFRTGQSSSDKQTTSDVKPAWARVPSSALGSDVSSSSRLELVSDGGAKTFQGLGPIRLSTSISNSSADIGGLFRAREPPGFSRRWPLFCWQDWYEVRGRRAGSCESWGRVEEVEGGLLGAGWLGIPRMSDGRLVEDMGMAGLKGWRWGAGARISLPTWWFPVGGVIGLIWRGLVGTLEKSADEWWTTCTGGGAVVCGTAAGVPRKDELLAMEGLCEPCCNDSW